MRITNQQILNQATADVRKVSDGSTDTLTKGQVLKAIVRDVMQDGLVLELRNGSLLKATIADGVTYSKGDTQTFEVVENGYPALLKSLGEEAAKTLEQTLEGLFKGSGEQVTPEKMGAAKALLSFGQPISKEGINSLLETSKQVDTLKGLIESDIIKLEDIPPKSPVKQILISFYKNSGSDQASAADKNTSELTSLLKSSQSADQTPASGLRQGASAPQQDVLREGADAARLQTSRNIEQTPLESQKATLDQNSNQETAQTIEKLANMLGQVDYQKLAFHKSAGMENSVFNLAMLEKLVFGKETIGKQVGALIETLNASFKDLPDSVKVLLEDLKGLDLGKDAETEKALQKVLDSLEKSVSKESESLETLKEDLTSVKQSVSYMREMNSSMTYMQIPVRIDQNMHSVDFFMKKRRGNDRSSDELTIFISLDTQHIGTVQSLIEYQKNNLKIQFRVGNEETVDYLENQKDALMDSLSEITDQNISVSFIVRDSAQSTLDTIAEISATEAAGIDVRV